MDAAGIVALVVIGEVVALVVLYVIIRFASQHGMRAALREHEAWMRDGSFERYLDRHAEQLAENQRRDALDRAELAKAQPVARRNADGRVVYDRPSSTDA